MYNTQIYLGEVDDLGVLFSVGVQRTMLLVHLAICNIMACTSFHHRSHTSLA